MSLKESYLSHLDLVVDLEKAYLEALADKYVSISRGKYVDYEKALERSEVLRRVLVQIQKMVPQES